MTDREPSSASRGAGGRCPICGKPVAQAFRPFCSPRCKSVDLNRWLTGAYVIPGVEDEVPDKEDEA